MEYILDIDNKNFEKIKAHETTVLEIPAKLHGQEIKLNDTLKLYHPGDSQEALRIEIIEILEEEPQKRRKKIKFELSEWMCYLETELDEMLREEEAWKNSIF